jgi:hypothetical protein
LIHSLLSRCARIGYHPKIWHIAIVIVLAKPGKLDSDPRAYHLIQLLECIGKVLEKIIADRLMFFLTNPVLPIWSTQR